MRKWELGDVKILGWIVLEDWVKVLLFVYVDLDN